MGLEIDNRDYELMECRNFHCGRRHQGLWTDAKFCRVCFSKLKMVPKGWANSGAYKDAPMEEATPAQMEKGGGVQPGFGTNDRRPGWGNSGYDQRQWSGHYRESTTDWIGEAAKRAAKTDSKTFTCNDGEVEGCPVAKLKQPELIIPYDMYSAWVFLAMKYKTEWFAYLKGARDEQGAYKLTEMYFPKQKVNPGHATVIPQSEGGTVIAEGTIGAVHSHVAMGAFFSQEDKAHANHEVEIVVNNRGDIETSVRAELECHRFQRTKANLIFCATEPIDAFCLALDASLIVEEKPTTTYGYLTGGHDST